MQPHIEGDRSLKLVAAAAGIPFRTAQRWVALYQKFGLTALARKRRTDRGEHRQLSVRLKEAIEGISGEALHKPVAVPERNPIQFRNAPTPAPSGCRVVA